jgi:hypothetical protein
MSSAREYNLDLNNRRIRQLIEQFNAEEAAIHSDIAAKTAKRFIKKERRSVQTPVLTALPRSAPTKRGPVPSGANLRFKQLF